MFCVQFLIVPTVYSVVERQFQLLNSHIKVITSSYSQHVARRTKNVKERSNNVNNTNDANIQTLQYGSVL